VDTDVSSSVMSRMVTLVLGSPSFSAIDLMVSRVDLALIFRLTTTLCECGSVTATSAKVCEGVNVGISFRGYLRVRFIWGDQQQFGNSALGGYSSSEVLLRGER
jgi:hypothetical protein